MPNQNPYIAIACGGTGGHLFPGLAIAEALQQKSCEIALLVSAKEVDQEAVKSAVGMDVITLPAIALQGGDWIGFLKGFWASSRLCAAAFRRRRPNAVLAMGGFTSAPPILAGRFARATTFLHESNSIPGRANRLLAPLVDEAFVGFAIAAGRLRNQSVKIVGTPVRSQLKPSDPAAFRMALGLDPARPVLLVMGGSQGASGINDLVQHALPLLSSRLPDLQFIHLTGLNDREKVAAEYARQKRRAMVLPFLTEMELALGAATVAVSRAGASSLAEFTAMRLPSILIPFPSSADNHQFHNAAAYAETGAARQLDQAGATPQRLTELVVELITNSKAHTAMTAALARWHFPNAAEEIAESIVKRAGLPEIKQAMAGADAPGATNSSNRVNRSLSPADREFRFSHQTIK